MCKEKCAVFLSAISIYALIFGILIFLLGCIRFWGYTMDDAFITFRYARNFVRTGNFLWNLRGGHEFGFSSYLYTLISSIIIATRVNILFWSKLLGVFFGALTIILIAYLNDRFFSNKIGWFPAVFFAIFPYTWFHSISGMETMLFTFLVLLTFTVYLMYSENRNSSTYSILLVLVLFFLILCRWEGLLIYSSVLLSEKIVYREKINKILFLPFLEFLVLVVFNYFYFGQPLPNPFYFKHTKSVRELIFNIYTMFQFLWIFSPNIVVSILSDGFDVFYNKKSQSLFLFITIYFVQFLVTHQTSMNIFFRFSYPVVPLILTLFGFGCEKKFTKNVSYVLVVFVLLLYPLSFYKEARDFVDDGAFTINRYIALGKIFGKFPAYKNFTIATFTEAGATPYYSDYAVFDPILNNKYVIKNGLDTDYFYDKISPEFIVMSVEGHLPIDLLSVKELQEVLKFQGNTPNFVYSEKFLRYVPVALIKVTDRYKKLVLVDKSVINQTYPLIKSLSNFSDVPPNLFFLS